MPPKQEVCTAAEELKEQFHLVGCRAEDKPRQRFGHHGPRSRIKRCELLSKRGNSSLRCDTLRFDPIEVRLCFRELGDERVTTHGRRDIRKLFFGGRFHGVGGSVIPHFCCVKYGAARSLDRGLNESRP